MPQQTILLVAIVVCALLFDYINGFHDTANAIATVVSTRVLPMRAAVLMAAVLNVLGALSGTAVAETIATGIVRESSVTQAVILAAVLGAIIWNLITWRFGIPSSSSHALIGGLCGADMVHGGPSVLLWQGINQKVILPMFASPIAGFFIGALMMSAIYLFFGRVHPSKIGAVCRRLQIVSAATMAFAHGSNDAQKSMGIITLALVSYGLLAAAVVPTWVIYSCATAMALGTAAGGYRIMKTMGHKIIRLEPVQGFAAETTAAAVIFTASSLAMPVSTTHVISGSIFGVGAAKRFSAVRWGVAEDMLMAWTLTLPAAATFGALAYTMIGSLGIQ